ncbi:putative papain-like cysteine peptidase superfamily [Helianthus annuus]|nr:putative papain-like cysteine peptidase superfamily [Helianthus annuus]KAJ0637162.1 putative papain-like cysteine peptidase superfamily [Helianthus annuus]
MLNEGFTVYADNQVIKEAKAQLDPLISFAKNAGFMSRDPDSSPKDDNEIQSKGEKKTQSQETKTDCNTGVNVNSVENMESVHAVPLVSACVSNETMYQSASSQRSCDQNISHIISDEKDEENVVDSTDETLVPTSPYINRVVELSEKLTFVEKIYSDWIFSARGFEMDVFQIEDQPDSGLTRIVLETLSHDEYVHFVVVNVWARILNHEEKFKAGDKIKRLFCTYQMLDGGTYGSRYEMMQAEFFGNMIKVLKEEQVASLKEVDLLFIPFLQSDHFYLVCFHMKKCQIAVIDNNSLYDDSFDLKYRGWPEKLRHLVADFMLIHGVVGGRKMHKAQISRLKMSWRTVDNKVDCGIFLMRHMETFEGSSLRCWRCGFVKEVDCGQKEQLDDLRCKYATKILLHYLNARRQFVYNDSEAYIVLDAIERERLKEQARGSRVERMKLYCLV